MMTWRLRVAAAVMLGAILAVCVVLPIVVLATSSGVTYGGTGGNTTPSGDVSWSDTGNAAGSSTGTAASAYLDGEQTSDALIVTNYGFAIPTGANINTITVKIYKNRGTEGGRPIDILVQLRDSTGFISTNKADSAYWSTTAAETTYTWTAGSDTMPTVSEINASTFGVGIRAQEDYAGANPVTAYVYYISIEIDYTESGGGGGPGAGGNATNAFWFEP